MAKIYDGHEFEALKEQLTRQAELLYRLTIIDLKIVTGFLTIQFVMGSWLALHRDQISTDAGLFSIDVAMAILAIKVLYNQYQRRKEVVGTVKNCNEALGYEEPGVYLDGKALDAPTETRYWFYWYAAGIVVSVIGIAIVLFG